jgi:hypothetical protein
MIAESANRLGSGQPFDMKSIHDNISFLSVSSVRFIRIVTWFNAQDNR